MYRWCTSWAGSPQSVKQRRHLENFSGWRWRQWRWCSSANKLANLKGISMELTTLVAWVSSSSQVLMRRFSSTLTSLILLSLNHTLSVIRHLPYLLTDTLADFPEPQSHSVRENSSQRLPSESRWRKMSTDSQLSGSSNLSWGSKIRRFPSLFNGSRTIELRSSL